MPESPRLCIDLLQLLNTQSQQPTQAAYLALKQQTESAFFIALLQYTQGNKSAAARLAGIDTGTLTRKLQLYCIRVEKKVMS